MWKAPGEQTAREVPWEDVPTDDLVANPEYWALAPGQTWHGFNRVAPNYAMTDPNKLTLLMPGFDRVTGQYQEHGVPAVLLAEYLRENRIVPEKNDLHSILFLLTPGVESSKAGTLLSWLVTFKRLHDENAKLQDVVPNFVRKRPARYQNLGLARPVRRKCIGSTRDQATSAGCNGSSSRRTHLPELVHQSAAGVAAR